MASPATSDEKVDTILELHERYCIFKIRVIDLGLTCLSHSVRCLLMWTMTSLYYEERHQTPQEDSLRLGVSEFSLLDNI